MCVMQWAAFVVDGLVAVGDILLPSLFARRRVEPQTV